MSSPLVGVSADSEKKAHPWRRCPMGQHFVKEHSVCTHPSKKNPNGSIIIRHAHCAANHSHKDELSFNEIQYITQTYFPYLQITICAPESVIEEYSKANNYDREICGWTKYWNEVFQPEDPLDPKLIKALILTESGFDVDPKPKLNKNAHGLMQVLTKTFGYLSDIKGELDNYLVCIKKEHFLNPSANICAGIRWLFRKKETAAAKLKHKATWINALEDYKSYLNDIIENIPYDENQMIKFMKYYKLLQETNNENKNPALHLMLEPVE